jgi:AraC-like DNA-binding protein
MVLANAGSLGYIEVSAFNHAFRRWIGQSPGRYRRGRAAHSEVRKNALLRCRNLD